MNRISFQDLPGASNTYNFHRPDSDVMYQRNSVYDCKAIQNSWKCFMTTFEMVVIL